MATMKVILLLATLSDILMTVGYYVAGRTGVITAIIFPIVLNLGSYCIPTKLFSKCTMRSQFRSKLHPSFLQ